VSAAGRGFNTGTRAAGGSDGLCTNDFGGTSSATPLVAGLCALLLSIDAKLSLAQIRGILKSSSRKIGPASAYDPNGHSTSYGWGRLDAAAAVALVAEAAKAKRKRPAAKARTQRASASHETRELRISARRAAPRR
jgi:subtilisin family serine protease